MARTLVAANTAAHRARPRRHARRAGRRRRRRAGTGGRLHDSVRRDGPRLRRTTGAQVETDTAAAWLSVVERSQSEHTREVGVTALTEAAVRAANWRAILGEVPATTAFPGRA
ncbi:DUF4439 domain-containing protein [Rhodococcus hoagii]|nr:DUF4439 domain-containing protein [Prescottella equi]NKZ87585.1 DUF4439 domain-containing protein [Prescottella equi]